MRINSNTVLIEGDNYKELESIVQKIASDNSIENVEEVNITLTENEGLVSFKEAKDGCGYVAKDEKDKKKKEKKDGKEMTEKDLKTMGMSK